MSLKPSPHLFIAACAVLLLSACGSPNAGPATPTKGTPTVGVVTLEARDVVQQSELPGRTAAFQIAEVRPQVSGIIQARLFREGSDVEAGEVLYEIAPATYQAAYGRAKAALAKAEANLALAKTKAERYQNLVAIHAVSQQVYDDAASALTQAEAEVASARAELDTQRINLEYTRIKAPISGRIGRSSVTPGALVTDSQATPLATLRQLDPIYVDLTRPSATMLRLERALETGLLEPNPVGGANVTLKLEDGSTYALAGKLQFSERTVDRATGAVTLRAVFPNPEGRLLPGMYVRAVVNEGITPDAVLVPQRGVQRNSAGEPIAYVVGARGRLNLRTLVVGRATNNAWIVSQGLSPGERVVVEGLQHARDGIAVNAEAWTPETDAPSLARTEQVAGH